MTYKVVFTQLALDDLEQIVFYIAKDNSNAALKLHDKIMETTNKLITFPMLGRLVLDEKIGNHKFRMLLCERYVLLYKVYDNDIVILRIAHESRYYTELLSMFVQEDMSSY